MTAYVLPTPKQQYFAADGVPLVGGRVYTYEVGSSVEKAAYTDAAGLVPHSNPIVLDARGETAVYWNGFYRVEVCDANDSLLYSFDQYGNAGGTAYDLVVQLQSDLANTAPGLGASLVGTEDGGNVQQALNESAAAIAAETEARIAADLTKANDDAVVHNTGNEDVGGIKNFLVPPVSAALPTLPTQVVNKQYADAISLGFFPKLQVRAATVLALPANTYANGALGVGATITANAVGVLTANYTDDVAIIAGDRVWITQEASGLKCGLYTYTQVGTAGLPFIFTRVTDVDTAAELGRASAYVMEGSARGGYTFAIGLDAGSITVGTTSLTPIIVSGPINLARVIALESKLPDSAPEGFSWSVIDQYGLAAIGVFGDGTFYAADAHIDSITVSTFNGVDADIVAGAGANFSSETPEGFSWSVIDALGFAAIGVMDDGTFAAEDAVIENLEVTNINGVPADSIGLQFSFDGTYLGEYSMRFAYGQSVPEGSQATPVVSVTAEFDNKMFAAGVRTQDGGSDRSSLVPLVESVSSTRGETPISGALSMLKRLILGEDGIAYTDFPYQLIGSCPSEGGKNASELSKGSAYFTRLIADVTGGMALAVAAGKTFNVPAYYMGQMEADYGAETLPATWEATRTQLYNDAISAVDGIKFISGQANDPYEINVQCSSHLYYTNVAGKPTARYGRLAQKLLDMCNAPGSKFVIACPQYMLTYAADTLHLTAVSERRLGGYMGIADKRCAIDGAPFRPLQIIGATRQGNNIILEFHVPVGPLVLDTSQVALNTNYGIELYTSGVVAKTINSVTRIAPNRLKLACAVTPNAGDQVYVAMSGSGGNTGPINGARSNIRDSQGDSALFQEAIAGQTYRYDNWAVHQIFTVT